MAIKNTERSFGAVAKAFHWATVLLVIGSYTAVNSLDFFVRATPEWRRVLHIHQWIGFTIFFVVLARLYWRAANKYPDSLTASGFEKWAAHIAHGVLYFFLLAMPLTGWAGSKMNRSYLYLFDVPSFYNTPLYKPIVTDFLHLTDKQFEDAVDFFHYGLVGPYLLSSLIVLHISAALYHHFLRKDATLVRMLPGQVKPPTPRGETPPTG